MMVFRPTRSPKMVKTSITICPKEMIDKPDKLQLSNFLFTCSDFFIFWLSKNFFFKFKRIGFSLESMEYLTVGILKFHYCSPQRDYCTESFQDFNLRSSSTYASNQFNFQYIYTILPHKKKKKKKKINLKKNSFFSFSIHSF